MSYKIIPSEDKQFIIIKVKGEINRKTAMQQNQEAHALGKKLGINRYLLDLTEARNTDPLADQYNFAYEDMAKAEEIDRKAVVAILVSEGDHTHDFIVTVTRNIGLNVSLFTDGEKAESSLLSRQPPPPSPPTATGAQD